ncbi:MAG: succinate dehydrogenase, hydrophobic membrane anchor protein [Rhodocyclaceae bacterium]|nr:succinate dehydrogenase, hydrophobic membrane anchor protein [Rhodocyclaceae bacterium]
MVNRIVTGAHYGLRDWLIQRLTAGVMLVFSVIAALRIAAAEPGFDGWKGVFDPAWMRVALFLFLLSVLYHAWIGVRDIYMDYVKPVSVRLALHTLTVLALVACAGGVFELVWSH